MDVNLESSTSTEATFQLTSFIATAPSVSSTSTSCDVYGPTDFWYWGYGAGKCCGLEGGVGLDAADILTQELNYRRPLPANHLYFVDIESVYLGALENMPFDLSNPDDDIFDGIKDYLVYNAISNTLPQAECVNPTDMNWYYCNIYDIALQAAPTGKVFSFIDLFDDEIYNGFGYGYEYVHRGWIYYGTSVQCPCPPCPPIVPQNECPQCC